MPIKFPAAALQKIKTLIPSDARVIAAVSGGSDSVALFCLLHELQTRGHIRTLGIAHVNHNLRGKESDQDELFVGKLAKKYSVEFYSLKLPKKSVPKSGIEAWARAQRYKFFAALSKSKKFTCVATGHTRDDQAETVLLNLFRGTGLSGLCGISESRDDGVVRPILSFTRQELRDWLATSGTPFRDDSSNESTIYRRNWIRHKVLLIVNAEVPSASKSIAQTAELLTQTKILVQRVVDQWCEKWIAERLAGKIVISKKGVTADPVLATHALLHIFKQHEIEVDRYHLSEIVSNAHKTGIQILLAKSWRCAIQKISITIYKGSGKSSKKSAVKEQVLKIPGTTIFPDSESTLTVTTMARLAVSDRIPDDHNQAFLDKNKIVLPLKFRTVTKTDKFIPFGRKASVNILEFLKKQGKTQAQRQRSIIVIDETGSVLWVVGVRISQAYAVSDTTRQILKFSLTLG